MSFAAIKARWSAFTGSPWGKRTLQLGQWLLTAGILGYLAWSLTDIGWGNVWEALPRTPWFYLIFVGMYFTLPAFEGVIYRLTLGIPWRRSFPALVKKRVYNKDVMGYSGEVYLFAWARRQVSHPDRKVMHVLKDNVILSSVVSTIIAVGLLLAFLTTGQIELPVNPLEDHPGTVLAVVAAAAVLGLVGLRYRKRILHLPGRALLAVAGLHAGRLLVVQALQIAQWAVVMPEVPLSTWFTFLAVQIILNRVPFLPSQDLVFLGAGLELSKALSVSTAGVGSMLLAASVLDKATNAALFALVSFLHREQEQHA